MKIADSEELTLTSVLQIYLLGIVLLAVIMMVVHSINTQNNIVTKFYDISLI